MRRYRIVNEDAPAPRGRPRSASAHAAILDATVALLREIGYDALAIELVAARAGVGKMTVYRRWPGKEELVIDAIHRIVSRFSRPATGTTRGDLRALMRATVAMYRDPATAELLSGLIGAMARTKAIADAVRERLVAVRRDAFRIALRAGIARGDLRRGTDVELAADLLSGPLFYRALLTGGKVNDHVAESIVDIVLKGLSPARSR